MTEYEKRVITLLKEILDAVKPQTKQKIKRTTVRQPLRTKEDMIRLMLSK